MPTLRILGSSRSDLRLNAHSGEQKSENSISQVCTAVKLHRRTAGALKSPV